MSVRSVLCLVVMAFTCACATVDVRHVVPATGDARLKEEGVFYALPKTVAKVQVKVEKTAKTIAPYMMFAPIFAPGGQALCSDPAKCRDMKDSTEYVLAEGVTFNALGEPDPDHLYLVKISGGGTLDQTMSMAWSDTGLPTSAASSVTNRTIDVAVAGVKMATNLGSKAFLGAGTVLEINKTDKCPTDAVAGVDDWVIPELEKIGAADSEAVELAIANYCDMPKETREKYQKRAQPSDPTPADQLLLRRAVSAFKLRVLPYSDRRTSLLTETTGSVLDPGALIDRLDKIVDAQIKGLFLGESEKTVWEPTFEMRQIEITPAAPFQLLQLDAANGPCPKADLTFDSKPLPAKFATKTLLCTSTHPAVTVKVALFPAAGQVFEGVKNRVAAPPADKERSFRYRIPAQVKATVLLNEKDHGSGVFSVAQLGHVVSLPAKRASKMLSYNLGFVEATGGLKSFKLGSTGNVDAATIQSLSDAGGTVLDARKTKRDEAEADAKAAASASATAADELTIITRQHTLLKLKHEICEIQKQYGLACTVQP